MKRRIKVLIVDDHPVFRAGLRQVIASDSRFEVSGEAADGAAALELAQQGKADIAIFDIDLPKLSGLEVARRLRRMPHPPHVIVLTMYEDGCMIDEALDLGVKGYVLKENAVVDILNCLQAVAEGECYLSPSISKHLVKRRHEADRLRSQKPGLNDLTPMERRVLKLLAENKTSKEIGAELFISPRTVDTHRQNIALKLNLHGARRLFQFALENKAAL
ncbi:MAG: response regulator transcription factor [Verrucomicrobia bacterium]|nr:response regulator transcription factor [Verrucomicrobiota bacterium]